MMIKDMNQIPSPCYVMEGRAAQKEPEPDKACGRYGRSGNHFGF